METTYAVCRLSDGLVVNTIIASKGDLVPDGCELVEIYTGQECSRGYFYDNGSFYGPKRLALCDAITGQVLGFNLQSYRAPPLPNPEGYIYIEVTKEMDADIGYIWNGTRFLNPSIEQ